MSVGWVYSPIFLRHETGAMHPERAERLVAIVDALTETGLLERMLRLTFESAAVEILEHVHEPAYVALVEMACGEGMTFIGSRETRICRESFDVARLAAGGVLAACDAVMAGRVGRAFCAVRPPGHHAEREQAMGYCLFNNVAVAADYLIRHHGLQRVAIVDWDVHHGNGTQQIFEDRDDLLYVSLHEAPEFLYPHTGSQSETGRGRGVGYTLNIPLPPGCGDSAYRQAFADKVIPRLEAFAPDFVIISAGFDAAREDHTAHMDLEPSSFAWMTEELMAVAARNCSGRVVSVLEGGYDLGTLGRCVVAHVQALLDTH